MKQPWVYMCSPSRSPLPPPCPPDPSRSFLIIFSLDYCKPRVNFEFWKARCFVSFLFCQCSYCFYERAKFQKTLLYHSRSNSTIIDFVYSKPTIVWLNGWSPPAMQETQEIQFQALGQEYPLEEEMATHPSILAWKIPWTEEPGGLQSKRSQRSGHDWATKKFPLSEVLFSAILVTHCLKILNRKFQK